jgi:hypothetical protein
VSRLSHHVEENQGSDTFLRRWRLRPSHSSCRFRRPAPKRRAGGGATMWSPPRCSETAPTPRPRLPPPPMPRRPPTQARPADPIEGLMPSVDRCPVRDRRRAGCPRASDQPAGGTAACPPRSRRRSVICSGAMTSPAGLAAGACQGAVRRGVFGCAPVPVSSGRADRRRLALGADAWRFAVKAGPASFRLL